MEPIQKDDPNPEMSAWVEELERQRALFGERAIYVSAQLFGSALRATGFLPQLDGRELRFRLLPLRRDAESSQPYPLLALRG